MNEKFSEYVAKGFDFYISLREGMWVEVGYNYTDGEGWERVVRIFSGDNLDHAFAACDLFLEA